MSCLEVLSANKYEACDINQRTITEAEVYFYRGGQVEWLNFFSAERIGPGGTTQPSFIKRDGYKGLTDSINAQLGRCRSVATVHLDHQPGSGGTTLARQVLWDFRKTLRCAVLKDSTMEASDIATQVINLFTTEGEGKWNTVLLLVDNLPKFDKLQKSILQQIVTRALSPKIPVMIALICTRKVNQKVQTPIKDHIFLGTKLSKEEEDAFNQLHAHIKRTHLRYKSFYAFNVMQTNFKKEYIRGVVEKILKGVQSNERNTQLLSFLALMNSYLHGSSLLESNCMKFLGPPEPIHGGPSFKERMQPFSDLLVSFTTQEKVIRFERVRMAHSMIAAQCCETLFKQDLTRGAILKNLLTNFVTEERDTLLEENIKDMLVKRSETKFSPLVHSMSKEVKNMCVSVLQKASNTLKKDPFIPQVLARYYYIRERNYSTAVRWAKEAKQRAPNNSFVADTLGQVYKNQLKYKLRMIPRQHLSSFLELADNAIKAFEEEQKLANKEEGEDLEGDGMARKSDIYNNRGFFGHMQVAKIVFDIFASIHPKKQIEKVLTQEIKISSLQGKVDDKILPVLQKYSPLLTSLKASVERLFGFFEPYLTYSKPNPMQDDPQYLREEVIECFLNYTARHCKASQTETISESLLKSMTAASFPGVLYHLRGKDGFFMEVIKVLWENVYTETTEITESYVNYVLANVVLSCLDQYSALITPCNEMKSILCGLLERNERDKPPELYFLVLLLFWPDGKASDQTQDNSATYSVPDLNILVTQIEQSFHQHYGKYLRSRYIIALFFLGKSPNRLVHKPKLDACLEASSQEEINEQWRNGLVWQQGKLQELLQRVSGFIRKGELFACYEKLQIAVRPDNRAEILNCGEVSFYLGFTMKGPVAFDIQYRRHS
ncbi:sterile alpha motif domain-containing protein 9 [Amia ocellicauda]|uniref:sterile alpha motif domain-containing protein 9 n=1 Tax=Amia ocellicauda TaxID=2972642 RepID=UPI003464DC87